MGFFWRRLNQSLSGSPLNPPPKEYWFAGVCRTLEGTMTGKLGDWLIRGVKGELYPCKPDIFHATYEAVRE